MAQRTLVILGSTGSIGKSTLQVIDAHPGEFRVLALAAYSNDELLAEQYRKYRPDYVCLVDPDAADRLTRRLHGQKVKVLTGQDEMTKLAALPKAEIILNAVVGAAGLHVSLKAVGEGKKLALANKESLVAGGPLFRDLCKETGAGILPVDSEHSAIWQALMAGEKQEIRQILLTGSGGPFRELPLDKFSEITLEQALAHPTWSMGPKITIDSATMANKGLEVLEAIALFDVTPDEVRVVIHPQSIIHSMVEFCDSSTIAQLSLPDMKLPITFALFWPDRADSAFGRIDWSKLENLTFEQPDFSRFPALALAYDAANSGGTAPAVFNAANEAAVEAFLGGGIKFTQIADIIGGALRTVPVVKNPELDDILKADSSARLYAQQIMEETTC